MLYNISHEIEKREKAWNQEPTLLQQTEQMLQTTAQIVASVSINPNKDAVAEIDPSGSKQLETDPAAKNSSELDGEKHTADPVPEHPDFRVGAEVLLANASDVIKKALILPPQDQQDNSQTYLDLDDDEEVPLQVGIVNHPIHQRMQARLPPTVKEHTEPAMEEPQPAPNALQLLQGGNKSARSDLGLEKKPAEANLGHQTLKGSGRNVNIPSRSGRKYLNGGEE